MKLPTSVRAPSMTSASTRPLGNWHMPTALLVGLCLFVVLLATPAAHAGTTGTEFQSMYSTLLNWATGYLGKAIAVAAFILGAGIGVARSSPIPALVGVVFALFMVYVPNIIDSIMTATI
jgi:conjugal transfer pilus assembly protein TraA